MRPLANSFDRRANACEVSKLTICLRYFDYAIVLDLPSYLLPGSVLIV